MVLEVLWEQEELKLDVNIYMRKQINLLFQQAFVVQR